MASYSDQSDIEFQVDPAIEKNQYEVSQWLAIMYGRIPKLFRGCVKQFKIIVGNNYHHLGHILRVRELRPN